MLKNFINRLIEPSVVRRVRQALLETENTFTVGWRSLPSERDRADYDREQVLEQALDAWRSNPLARRIVELTTQYVVGGGLRIRCEEAEAAAFLGEWWEHPLNRLPLRLYEWCDELSRAGELFLLLTTDVGGMSYVRATPAAQIYEVQTAANDVQQELAYLQRGEAPGEERAWPAYDAQNDLIGVDGGFQPTMLHYTVNRPVGAVRGESDLAPVLRWLSRYSGWLEDRARLNRFRNTFVFTVKARFASESERLARQAALAANPPGPGSILVTDESEEWGVISPRLESHEAGEDGLALKKMIAAGAGIPMHFLAEPESATRTTAEAAGGPAYRRLEQRQQYFCWLVSDLARAALRRWGLARGMGVEASLRVEGADLSARDNAALASATAAISSALLPLWERGLVKDEEMLRLVYRFAGEVGGGELTVDG